MMKQCDSSKETYIKQYSFNFSCFKMDCNGLQHKEAYPELDTKFGTKDD